jgi:putative protein kinase ArgK-like GTPase of G3E family
MPETKVKSLYIRECYQSIATSIFHHSASSKLKDEMNIKITITGTPGVGKSLFLFYLLHKLVTKGKRVLLIDHPYADIN